MNKKRISAFLTALFFAAVMIFSGCSSEDSGSVKETAVSSSVKTPEKNTASDESKEEITSESETAQAVTEASEETLTESSEKSGQATASTGDSGGEKPVQTSPAPVTEAPSSAQQTTQPATEKPTEQPAQPQAETCTISINCSTILNNMDKLKEEKKGIVPSSGIILSGCETEIQEGDSVYDVLVRVCQQNKIHMDADYTPAYGSAYIKGIGNLYERDCGNLSGWTYRVNGVFPGVGCSSYEVKEGDVIEFLYTCNLGADVGNVYSG